MKVLIIGSGGREHAIAWKLRQSPRLTELYCAPGNGGIAEIAECVDIKATDIDGVVAFAKDKKIDMVVVAPDDPLAMGMVDALEAEGIRAFGPRKNAAVIESSKAFSKELMRKYSIPTASYEIFEDSVSAVSYLDTCSYPIVVKADGLALGKGVVVAQDKATAIEAVKDIMVDKRFGDSGNRVVIEECLAGPEVSVLCFCDGKTILPMAEAQDHKRVFDNDKGPNTGGMGTFSPCAVYTPEIAGIFEKTIMRPTVEALNAEGRPFKGVIFFGLMITQDGPKVIEYNARFGDPEAQVVLPRLENDLLDVMDAVIDGKLDEIELSWSDKSAVCVVLASGGYPGKYNTGYEIEGLDKFKGQNDIIIFHAGTKRKDGHLVTAGGRVMGVTALADTKENAREAAYRAVEEIGFEGKMFRRDIGIKK